jgi:hypothetical protein
MKYSIILVLYLINAGAYLIISPEYKALHKNEMAAWYFGSEGLFTAVLLYLACNARTWIAKQLVYVTAGFIGIRSILYILNYTLILTIDARIRMYFLCLYSLIIVIPSLISAYRHGHFKD